MSTLVRVSPTMLIVLWFEAKVTLAGLGIISKACSRMTRRDFPGSPVVKTSSSNAGGAGSIPGQGAKIPHASGPKNQNIKQKQYCNKFSKDFENVHIKKIFKK